MTPAETRFWERVFLAAVSRGLDGNTCVAWADGAVRARRERLAIVPATDAHPYRGAP